MKLCRNSTIRRRAMTCCIALSGCTFFLGWLVDCAAAELAYSFSGGGGGWGGGWGGGDAWSYSGIGGHVGGDGETFYFLDGDSSYISGP